MSKELVRGSSLHQACASCKHQRKKCDETCELAPYFPATRYREFQNAHKLFGVSNIHKIINSIEPNQRQEAAESILMEGNIRCNDPVSGCLGVVLKLESQIELYQNELAAVIQQLQFFRRREKQHQQSERSTFDYQADHVFNPQAQTLPDIGDMKIGERIYNYQSTMEESADVKPFDIPAMEDPVMDNFQTGHAVSSLLDDQSVNSK